MMKLAFFDTIRSWRVWAGTVLLACLSAGLAHAAVAYIVSIIALSSGSTFSSQPGLQSHLLAGGFSLLLACVLPSLVVLAIILGLVAAQEEQSHALWRLGGASPGQVWTIFMVQAFLATAIGSIFGIALSVPFLQDVSDFMVRFGRMEGFTVPAHPSAISLVVTFIAVLLVGMISSSLPALRAARTSIITLTRERPTRGAMGVVRWILAGLAAFIFVAQLPLLFMVALSEDGESGFVSVTLTLGQILVVLAALLAPLLFPPFLRLWTRAVPPSATNWWLARHSTRARLRASTATVTPLMVGIGLYGVYFGVTSVWQAALVRAGTNPELNLLDGFLLFTPGAIVAALASIVAVFMVSRARNTELAILRTATATSADVVRMLIAEAIIYSVTATLLALMVVILPITLLTSIGLALQGLPFTWGIDLRIPGALALMGFLGTLVALLVTGLPSLRRPVRASLAQQ